MHDSSRKNENVQSRSMYHALASMLLSLLAIAGKVFLIEKFEFSQTSGVGPPEKAPPWPPAPNVQKTGLCEERPSTRSLATAIPEIITKAKEDA